MIVDRTRRLLPGRTGHRLTGLARAVLAEARRGSDALVVARLAARVTDPGGWTRRAGTEQGHLSRVRAISGPRLGQPCPRADVITTMRQPQKII